MIADRLAEHVETGASGAASNTYFDQHREPLEIAIARSLTALYQQQPDAPLRFLVQHLAAQVDPPELATPQPALTEVTSPVDAKRHAMASCGEWTAKGWLLSLAPDLSETIASALRLPGGDEFGALRGLSDAELVVRLEAAGLSGFAPIIVRRLAQLRDQAVATGAELNAKFAADGDAFKGEMGFGGLTEFFAGLEGLIGPPKMLDGSLKSAMEAEHCSEKDASLPFSTSNGISGATSILEWQFVWDPRESVGYVERGGAFRDQHPEWCRKPLPLVVYKQKMEVEINPRLVDAGQPELILEELIGGRLYTGPCYEKYNAVLRFFSGRNPDGSVALSYASPLAVPFLQKKCSTLNLGEWAPTGEGEAVRWEWHNKYPTTIHAINSIVVKMARLTKIVPLYRGWTGGTLPKDFFQPDQHGLRGGVEYGFSSTTTERAQALHYAQGKASTLLELEMGMVDRGADISWLSQYPHEKETLLPPLIGLQVLGTRIDGGSLVVSSRLSLNMSSLTLEQVAGKRKKLLADMAMQITSEVQRGLSGTGFEECGVSQLNEKLLSKTSMLHMAAEDYNVDGIFKDAVDCLLSLKAEVLYPTAKLEWIKTLSQEKLVLQAGLVADYLSWADVTVRRAAITCLSLFADMAAFHLHNSTISACLDDPDHYVRVGMADSLKAMGADGRRLLFQGREELLDYVEAQLAHAHLLREDCPLRPAKGFVNFFPNGWSPQRSVRDALTSAVANDTSANGQPMNMNTLATHADRLASLSGIQAEHALSLLAFFALTACETTLRDRLNSVLRDDEETFSSCRDFLHYIDAAIASLPSFAGTVYRGFPDVANPQWYTVGDTITWALPDAFDTATKKLLVAFDFLRNAGRTGRSGTLFVIQSKTGREVGDFTTLPAEEPILFRPNTRFEVVAELDVDQKAALIAPHEYEFDQVVVYTLAEKLGA